MERRLPGRVLQRPRVHQRQRHGRGHTRPSSLRRHRPGPDPAEQQPRARVRHSKRSSTAFGDPTGGNANVPCAPGGSFGDTKGVDLWTFYPGGQTTTALNIIANATAVSTSASSPDGIQVGETATVSDTAQLTGFNSLAANAAVEFSLVGPVADPTACPSAPLVLGPVSAPIIRATGTASVSRTFTPQAPGNYYWVARFPGDPGNLPIGPRRLRRLGRAGHGGVGDPGPVDADHRDLQWRRWSARRHLRHGDTDWRRQPAARRDRDLLARRTRRRQHLSEHCGRPDRAPIAATSEAGNRYRRNRSADLHAGGRR